MALKLFCLLAFLLVGRDYGWGALGPAARATSVTHWS